MGRKIEHKAGSGGDEGEHTETGLREAQLTELTHVLGTSLFV